MDDGGKRPQIKLSDSAENEAGQHGKVVYEKDGKAPA